MSECKHGSIPSHCPYCRIAELGAENAKLKAQLADDCSTCNILVDRVHQLEAENAKWKAAAGAMFAADEEYGCGFYGYPKWVAGYNTLAALLEGKE